MHTVEKQRLGFVATVSATGEPNLSPKGTFVVLDDRTLAFGGNPFTGNDREPTGSPDARGELRRSS